jgi:dTDP-4-amino-4,6-dideoxygalactose transaminase
MIPFAPPRIDQAIIDEVTATLKSGWITTGPRTKLLETRLTEFCGNKATLCLNSATAGLEVMLKWYGVGPGDEVILPAYTYTATANVIVHCGATPVLVDVGSDFNMDVSSMKAAITSRTKVIMPVDFGGLPCDYDAIMHVVKSSEIQKLFKANNENQTKLNRILILSDAAHSIGAVYRGHKTGSLTDVSVFSFHAVKNLTTAEGGAIALNLPAPFDNTEVYKYLCVFTLHGQNKDALAKMQKGNWKYDVIDAGYKCNMTDIAAAIGLVELDRYEKDMLARRKQICETYHEFFRKKEWAELRLLKQEERETSYHLYPLRIKGISEPLRDLIIQKIFDRDVSVNVHFIPLPLLTFYKSKGYSMIDYPNSYDAFSREISLPVFYDLNDEQISIVCNAVEEAVMEILKAPVS